MKLRLFGAANETHHAIADIVAGATAAGLGSKIVQRGLERVLPVFVGKFLEPAVRIGTAWVLWNGAQRFNGGVGEGMKLTALNELGRGVFAGASLVLPAPRRENPDPSLPPERYDVRIDEDLFPNMVPAAQRYGIPLIVGR